MDLEYDTRTRHFKNGSAVPEKVLSEILKIKKKISHCNERSMALLGKKWRETLYTILGFIQISEEGIRYRVTSHTNPMVVTEKNHELL